MTIETSFTVAASMHTEPMPVAPYISPDYYEREKERVFRRSWLVVGRVEEVANPRDYILRDIDMFKAQLIIVRQKDGSIKSLHNVCKHRGNRVAIERKGNTPAFVCNYHRWSYGTDGALRGVTDRPKFFEIDMARCGLTPVKTDVWNGFIFVNFDKDNSVSLADFLGDFGKRTDNIFFPFVTTPLTIEATLECNWKVVSDAFSEAYHVGSIHPATIGDSLLTSDNPWAHLDDIRFEGPHHSTSLSGNLGYTPPLMRKVEHLANAHMTGEKALSTTGNVFSSTDASEIERYMAHPQVNPHNASGWVNDLNMVFPNFHFDFSPGGFWTHQFWPLAYNRTRWESRWYVPAARNTRERFQQEHYVARLSEIMLEDLSNTERVQRGLESGALDSIQLQDNESLIRHLLIHLDKWIAADSVEDALAA